ncbi:MAG: lipopolysaccharide biosynthesis protein RfbH [Desulfovibrionaceae bacterium]|nr:lipopolysaccharide biosynthesis protein RfbH [Desulfovibrionaceae bacterium]
MNQTPEDIKKEIKRLAVRYYEMTLPSKRRTEYIPVSGKSLGSEELCAMIDASLDMWLTAGHFNTEFEKKFAEKLGVRYALSTNSGSSANLLAMTALTSPKLGERHLKKGDEVIAVAAGFPTTVNPIIQNGLIPVFVDIDLTTYNIDINRIEEAITPKTKAIFIAHTLGNMYDMDAMMALCGRYNLWMIEDSCDALGARWKDRFAGSIGHIGTFSFYPAHHMTMGEGGAVITNDSKLHRILMSIRDWGRDCWCQPGTDNTCKCRFNLQLGKLPMGYDHKYTYSHIGYNLKITDWQAAIGVEQLKKLDGFLEKRRQNAATLLAELADLTHALILPTPSEYCTPSWFGFLISVRPEASFSKQELVEYLESHGVGTRQLFAGNLLRQPMLTETDVELRIGSGALINSRNLSEEHYKLLPVTEFIMKHTFWVGTAQNIDENDEKEISRIIHEFVKSRFI